MSKILVTGGAGFIGSHLTDALLQLGHQVSVVDDLSGGTRENVDPSADFFACDIRKLSQLKKIFQTVKPDIVYHLAANAAENKAQFSPVDVTSRNFDGSIKVLTASIQQGVQRFIFTSSIAVYGQAQTPFREDTLPRPEDVYGVTKLAFEESLKILSQVHGFEYVIVRPHNVYGPRQNMRDPYRNVVTIFMNHILNNQPFYIYGDGSQQRAFSYIDDVTQALIACLQPKANNGIFNIGADTNYTINQLASTICRIAGSDLEPIYLPLRPKEVKIALSDHTLSRSVLSNNEAVDLETGLRQTWEWAKKQGYQKPIYTKLELPHPSVPDNWQ